MPLVTNRDEVLEIYREAAAKGRVIPTFCSENLTTTEAVLSAVCEYGDKIGEYNLPITLAITNLYSHRSQSVMYTQTRQWEVGLKLFLNDIKVLCANGSPFSKIRVMTHLDHVQPDLDETLLAWDFSDISSVMFDASGFPWDDNIRRTSAFVKARGTEVAIEGACDEIVDATGEEKSELTSPEKAHEYLAKTGVDFMVANLGTEHRASAADLKYHGELARKIKSMIGCKMVLHGCSSVPLDQIAELFSDGICKVNIWTALERDSSPKLLQEMVCHAGNVAGVKAVTDLSQKGYLGKTELFSQKADLEHFTTSYRQTIVFDEMKKVVTNFLRLWYREKQ